VAAARIKPAVVQVESHPYLPEWELLDFCRDHGIVLLAFAPLGHAMTPSVLQDPVITEIQHAITTNVRFNSVVQTGVPGFIPKVQ
jgi:diketogulonate reductase-like aldo/keto reductase